MISRSPSPSLLIVSLSLAVFIANVHPLTAQKSGCEVFWKSYSGESLEFYLEVDETWPLLHFLENVPGWWPQWEGGRSQAKPVNLDTLQWHPLPDHASLPRLTKIGDVTGAAVYEIYYGPLFKVIVQEREEWTFCPVWMYSVDENLIAAVEPSDLFSWENREYLSTRVFIHGMGALQESVFFSFHEDQIRHMKLSYKSMRATLEEQGWKIYHRNGGFREARLEWQNWAWKLGAARGTLRVVFTRLGRSLVIKDTVLFPEAELWKDRLGQ